MGWWKRQASRTELGWWAQMGTQLAQALVHKTAGFTFSFQLKRVFLILKIAQAYDCREGGGVFITGLWAFQNHVPFI